FTLVSGALPEGVTLSADGVISGRPQEWGEFDFTVEAEDDFGNTGQAALTLTVEARPDPSQDPDVRGLNTAQAEAVRRMAGTQLAKVNRSMEQLHDGTAQSSRNLSLNGSAFTPLDQNREVMGELAHVVGRGLEQDRRDPSGRDELEAIIARNRGGAWADPSLAEPGGPLGAAQGMGGSDGEGGVRVWAGGVISLGERDPTSQTAELSISTSGLGAGADVSLSETLDIGAAVGFGQERTDVGVDGSRMEGDSWLGMVYGSWRPTE